MAIKQSTSTREVPISRGMVAVVDEQDYELVSGEMPWVALRGKNGNWYAYHSRRRGAERALMHRLIVGALPGEYVDHRNGDGLDNRRENLRRCTNAQNMWNVRCGRGKSPYKGVSTHPHTVGRWRAYIVKGARQRHLGYFDTEIEAAMAYDVAAAEMFGEFAKLNLPPRAA